MAIELVINIPDEYKDRVVEAFIGNANTKMRLESQDGISWPLEYSNQIVGETGKDFGERVVRELIRAHVRLYEYGLDNTRYRDDVNAVTKPQQTVPDEIVE